MFSFGHTRAQQLDKSEVEVEHQATMLGVQGLQLNARRYQFGAPRVPTIGLGETILRHPNPASFKYFGTEQDLGNYKTHAMLSFMVN